MPPEEVPAAAAPETPATPPPNETPVEAFKRIEAELDASEKGEGEKASAAPEKTEKPKAKRETKEVEKPASDGGEAEQLRQLATRLGYQIEDGKVVTAERYKLREERRANLAAIQKAEADAISKVEAIRKEVEGDATAAKRFREALKAGDFDAIAKLGDYASWDAMQEEYLKRHSDPNHVRLRELEERIRREDEERAERERTEKERAEQTARQQAEAAERARYRTQLQATMDQSQEPLVKAMSKMPNFVTAIFNVQQRTWDGTSSVMTPERAVKYRPEGGVSLEEELRGLYDALSPVFAAKQEPPAGTVEKPKPKTAPIAKPSPRQIDKNDDAAWMESARERLRAAIEEDRRAKRI